MAATQSTRSRGGDAQRRADDEQELEQARRQIEQAISMVGCVDGKSKPACPVCGDSKRTKVDNADGKLICFRERRHPDGKTLVLNAIDLLVEHGGYDFVDALNLLLGRKASHKARQRTPRTPVEVHIEPDFEAAPDLEVYTWIARQGDRGAAQEFYSRWHIDPKPVAEAGCFYLPLNRLKLSRLQAEAIALFGRERLIACGVAQLKDPEHVRAPRNEMEAKLNDLYFAGMPPGYPVGEPHVLPDGRISYMQFRADGKTRDKVVAHKRWKKASEAAKAAGDEVPPKADYQAAFMSLKGAPRPAMVGGGVWRLARLDPGQTVVVVEGIKDLLAARTMGAEAYAIPGAQTLPPQHVCDILARHRVLVALDGDEAGDEARGKVIEYLREHGVTAIGPKSMPAGMDITDILVDRTAKAGCDCPTCTDWLASR